MPLETMDWLHWIGKSYYTINSFAKEAERYGATRRVSLNVLKRMNWGDTVYCCMLNGKSGQIFGRFSISKLVGLSAEAMGTIELTEQYTILETRTRKVQRGCGEYEEGETIQVEATLPTVARILENLHLDGVDIGKPMVAGRFSQIKRVRLLDIPFRQGFRKINTLALFGEATENNFRVHGQFYINTDIAPTEQSEVIKAQGQIQQVVEYRKNPNKRRKKQQKALLTVQLCLF